MDHVERNKRALDRAVGQGLTIRLEGGGTTDSGHKVLTEAFCDKPDGSWYQVWATAGSYLDGGTGYLVSFTCQCKAGAEVSHGVTMCKHEAALAIRLVRADLAKLDTSGRYRTTAAAGEARNLINLSELLYVRR